MSNFGRVNDGNYDEVIHHSEESSNKSWIAYAALAFERKKGCLALSDACIVLGKQEMRDNCQNITDSNCEGILYFIE